MRNSNYITISAVLTICEGLLTTVSTQILVTDARGHADLRKKSPGRTVLRENNFRIGYNFNNLNVSSFCGSIVLIANVKVYQILLFLNFKIDI